MVVKTKRRKSRKELEAETDEEIMAILKRRQRKRRMSWSQSRTGGLGGGVRATPRRPTVLLPVNVTLPAIQGEARVGQTLQIEMGEWTSPSPLSFTFQWRADLEPILGATGQTLDLTEDEQGRAIDAIVTATNEHGSTPSLTLSVGPVLSLVEEEEHAPTDIAIEPTSLQEKHDGANVGVVEVIDVDLPSDLHTFEIDDARFEIVDGILKLKSGQSIIFADEPIVNIAVTATDQTSLSVTVNFVLTVIEQILPDPNHAPIDIQLSATTINDLVFGDVIGTLTVTDEDLPGDTIYFTVDDDRFVVIGDQLRLKPAHRISALTEPTVTVTITATDATGEFIAEPFNLTVTTAEVPDLTNAIFVAPSVQGLANGTSFANAKGWSSINTIIADAALAGKQVLMASHLGTYTSATRVITSGGSLGAAVKVWGCDASGNAADIVIHGTRSDPWTEAGTQGGEVWKLQTGANHLHFRNITFTDVQTCFRVANDLTDLTIENCGVDNCTRFFDNLLTGAVSSATLTSATFRNCYSTRHSRSHIRLQYSSHDILIENSFGDGGYPVILPASIPVGIGLYSLVHDVTMINCEMRNHGRPVPDLTVDPAGNPNGDGYSSERDNYNIKYINCRATGNLDGGFDLKEGARNTLPNSQWGLFDCWSANNKKNYRCWRELQLTRCVGADPNNRENLNINQCQVHLPGTAGGYDQGTGVMPHIVLTDCAFVADSRPAPNPNDGLIMDYVFDPSFLQPTDITATLTIDNCSVQKHPDTPYFNSGLLTVTGFPDEIKTAPTNVTPPVITGSGVAGEPLTATAGVWSTDVTPFYQWLRDGDYIDDALGATYVLTGDDIGATISCRVFGKTAAGYIGSVTSEFAGEATATVPVNTAIPAISGVRVVGSLLTVIPGTWDGIPSPTLAYQWTRNGVDIGSATNTTYTLVTADLGTLIRIRETGTNIAGSASATSDPTAAIGAAGSVSIVWIRPAAHGVASGVDAANAVAMSSINSMISVVGADGIINIVSDDGTYSAANRIITHGGTSGHPVTIRGRTLANGVGTATFSGTRTSWAQPGLGTLTNPFTTTLGSATVTVAHAAHGLTGTPRRIVYSDATAVGGITISGPYTVTIVDPDSYTITHDEVADSGASGGGTVSYDKCVATNVGTGSWTAGAILFQLSTGASNLTFDHLHFIRVGNGCINITQNNSNITVTNCTYFNVQRFIEQGLSPVAVTNLTVTDCSGVGHSECAIRWRGNSSGLIVTDCDFDSARQSGDNFAMGIQFTDASHDATLTRVICRNTDGTYDDSSYWNGDGFVGESSNYNIALIDCESYGHTDGGYDFKSQVTFTNCLAEDNKHGFRIWGRATATDCISRKVYRRGGTGGQSHFMFPKNAGNPQFPIVIRPVMVHTGVSTLVEMQSDSQCWLQDIDDSAAASGTYDSLGTTVIYDGADVTPCTISTASTFEVFDGATFSVGVSANEADVMWKINGGADAGKFLLEYHTLSLRAAQQSGTPTDADLDSVYEVEVLAKDAGDQDTTKTISVSVVAPYAQAVTFDGTNDWISTTDDISSQGNAAQLFVAGRIRFLGGDGTTQRFMTQAGGVAQLTRNTSNKMTFFVASDAGGLTSFNGASTSDWVVADDWIDFMLKVQTNFAAGLKQFQLWKRSATTGGLWVNDAGAVTDADAAFSIGYDNRADWGFFATNAGSNKFNGDASDFIVSLQAGPDPSLQATRDKFALDNGTWVYPGYAGVTLLGYTPRWAFQGPASAYKTNKGTAGIFCTLHGTLVDSIDPPP